MMAGSGQRSKSLKTPYIVFSQPYSTVDPSSINRLAAHVWAKHGCRAALRAKLSGSDCLSCLRRYSNRPSFHDHVREDKLCRRWYALFAPDVDLLEMQAEIEADSCMIKNNKHKGGSLYGIVQPCGQLPGPLQLGACYTKAKRGRLLFMGG